MSDLKIIEEKNEYDDHILDIFGNTFRFEHPKGLSEWIKNSVDAYRRNGVNEKDQIIILNFNDYDKKNIRFECVDFVGMTEEDINKFKRWGDPFAASRKKKLLTYGGHGNGGKFYMRQMFEESFFVTYRDGILNKYGFNKKKRYGYLENGKNIKINPKEALQVANIDFGIIPEDILKLILNGKRGFTVVNGFSPKEINSNINIDKLLKKIKNHPQSRSIINRITVCVFHNNQLINEKLIPDTIKPLNGFGDEIKILIPEKIKIRDEFVKTFDNNFSQGYIILRTSEKAFIHNTELEELNRIDFISSKVGVVASYQLAELGVKTFPQASFIYGECFLPLLENENEYMISNDRTKLNDSPLTKAILSLISNQTDNLAQEILKKEQKDRKELKTEISSRLNNYLNKWKDNNDIMRKIFSEVFNDKGKGKLPGKSTSTMRKNLEFINGLSFSYSYVRLPIEEKYKLTLKANIKDIPLGAIINIISDNEHIDIFEKEIIIKNEFIKKTGYGEELAVINIDVIGKKLQEKGLLIAQAGKYKTEIGFEIIEQSNEGGGNKANTKILLSGIDEDPLKMAPNNKLFLSPREPLIYQRPRDFDEGIYWINTQSYLASSILECLGENSLVWRNYLIQRYVEIFLKEAIYKLQTTSPDSFNAERIDNEIFGKYSTSLYERIMKDLQEFLLKEYYDPTNK